MVRTWSSSGGGAGPGSPAIKASASHSCANDGEWNLGGPDCALNAVRPGAPASRGGLSKSIGYMEKVEGKKLLFGDGNNQRDIFVAT